MNDSEEFEQEDQYHRYEHQKVHIHGKTKKRLAI